MNLVDKYVEVVMATQGFAYEKEVLNYLNEKLGTQYRYPTLYNWRSSDSPRPVPQAVRAHMRETVVMSQFSELDSDLSAAQIRKLAGILNDEQQMRRMIIDTTLETHGIALSRKRRTAMTQSLETLYERWHRTDD